MKQTTDTSELYTSAQTRKKLDISASTLTSLVKKGAIEKVIPVGYERGYYTKRSVDEYYEQRQVFKHNYNIDSENTEDRITNEQYKEGDKVKIVFSVAKAEDMEEEYDLAKRAIGFTMSAERRREWYYKNPDCDFIVRRNGQLVSFIRLLPIEHNTLIKVMTGEMKGVEVTADDVETFEPGRTVECLVMGIAGDPELPAEIRVTSIRALLLGTMKELQKLGKKGVIISKIYATSTTPTGIAMSMEAEMKLFAPKVGGRFTFVMDVVESDSFLVMPYKKGLEEWKKSKIAVNK